MLTKQSISCLTILIAACGPAFAQGFRVETHIHRAVNGDRDEETLVSSSLTLFHNGRVYDYVESADEVTIFEPTARRFVILNTARSLRTTVAFDQIRHLLDARREESRQTFNELARSPDPRADQTARFLTFQLDPSFEEARDDVAGKLTLSAPSWKYNVVTHEWQSPDQVLEYLTYADWIARLNYVLHPSTSFPEPRMALNERLRTLGSRMPTSVTLDLRPNEPVVLRAVHRFVVDLEPVDRNLIRAWDAAATNASLRQLSFRRYQETVLLTAHP